MRAGIKRFLVWLCAAALAACAHGPSAEPELPRVIRDARAVFVDDCRPDAPRFAPDLILRADLNGDGKDDYVLNGFAYQCRGDTPYCGSAGCETQVFLSAPGGLLEQRFDGYLEEPPQIERGLGPARLVSGKGAALQRFDLKTLQFTLARGR